MPNIYVEKFNKTSVHGMAQTVSEQNTCIFTKSGRKRNEEGRNKLYYRVLYESTESEYLEDSHDVAAKTMKTTSANDLQRKGDII